MRDANSLKHAQNMRKSMPEPEARMWNELRATRFRAIKFRRQKVIGKFIADFAANEPKLVIELDGDTHAGSETTTLCGRVIWKNRDMQWSGFRIRT